MLFDPATGKGGRIRLRKQTASACGCSKATANLVGQSSAGKPAKKASKAKQKAAGGE